MYPGPGGGSASPTALDRLVAVARERRPGDELLVKFLRPYFHELADVELDERDLLDVHAVSVAHLELGRRREPGRTLVQVRSPELELDGWHTDRSLVFVVTDDAPFLVDSIRMVLDRAGIAAHLLVHPMLDVDRDADGELLEVHGPAGRSGNHVVEAWTQIEIDRCDADTSRRLEAEIERVVAEVHRLVHDFSAMRDRMAALANEDPLLAWLADGNYVFMGAATYDRDPEGGLAVRPGTQLGVLRSDHEIDPPPVPREISDSVPVLIARSDRVSEVHRPARNVSVSVRAPDGSRHRFIGLLAASAYRSSVLTIPSIGDRARAVLSLVERGPDSHTGRAARAVIETLPRELVFEVDTDRLAGLVYSIVGLQERRIVRVFEVPEPVGPWSTCFVYLPRDRYDAEVPERVEAVIAACFGGPTRDLEVQLGDSSLVRIVCTVRRGGASPDLDDVAQRVDEATTTWLDRVHAVAVRERGLDAANRLVRRFQGRVPVGFAATVPPERAVGDLERIARLADGHGTRTSALGRDLDGAPGELRFRVFRCGDPVPLSALLPLLGHLGLDALDERPATFHAMGEDGIQRTVHAYDIGVRAPTAPLLDASRHDEVLRTFDALAEQRVEADDLHRLVAAAGLRLEQVSVLRAYVRYLRQVGFAFSPSYIERTLVEHAGIAAALVRWFEARFDPALVDREPAISMARTALDQAIDAVQSLDDDRIVRALAALVGATVRTNAFRDTDTIAFKFDPALVPDLPAPRPAHEIFVCSPRVEGVHLRGGAIARGGIRWSDRREDFRTEVLGLVKAQMVKNAVIVPVGAKGGFVVKRTPDAPDELRAAVADSYREFIGALLDVTDDIVGDAVVHPERVVVHDGPDPYLVVAADKGTATFSDLANEVATSRGFWLGDAFASGGSAGYDHKAMGITARGAWESVRRHARSLGLDAGSDPITAVGIGDMSGDVFGNGMLRSRSIRLVAAFDHRHVFIDPDPDPEVGFAERSRLFSLPRSSWADYHVEAISAGGGVFARTAKSIRLSPEARAALGTDAVDVTPPELVRIVLRAPVDLLWNGGIGTYVKASTESHAEVGDRANDAVRVDGRELRCRMVGEGGNLGLTQRGRVEYALAGGLVNTDAIDNSAGVSCSDHEVNLKILLEGAVADGDLTRRQRDELLASMTDEVAELVLADNRAQTLALAIARRQALPMVNVHARYLDQLETERWLDRSLEFLPSDKQLAERQAEGAALTAPEFAVLIAYTKNADVTELLATDLPDDPLFERDLFGYFPGPVVDRFPDRIRSHRLRREIVATRVVNDMVNSSGISFDHRMTEETGAAVPDVVRAWVVAREILGFPTVWERIGSLEGLVPLSTQLELLLDARRMQERCSLWLLRHRRPPIDLAATIEEFAPGVRAFLDGVGPSLTGAMADLVRGVVHERRDAGIPEELAERSGVWRLAHTAFDVVEVAAEQSVNPLSVAHTYWEVFDRLDLMWLWTGIGALPRADRWQSQARSALRDDLLGAIAALTAAVVGDADRDVDAWIRTNQRALARASGIFAEIRRSDASDITTLSVALRQLRNLARTATVVSAP